MNKRVRRAASRPAPEKKRAAQRVPRAQGRLRVAALGLGLVLLLFAAVIPYGWAALHVAFLLPVLGSVLVVNLQLRLMDVAGDAETVGAAMNHASLNVANALGAWLGGLVLAAGWGYRAPAVVGAGLCVLGLAILTGSALLHRRDVRDAGAESPSIRGS